MTKRLTRREMLVKSGNLAAAGTAVVTTEASGGARRTKNEPFRYCLNTSTLRGHKLTLVQELEIVGYAALPRIASVVYIFPP